MTSSRFFVFVAVFPWALVVLACCYLIISGTFGLFAKDADPSEIESGAVATLELDAHTAELRDGECYCMGGSGLQACPCPAEHSALTLEKVAGYDSPPRWLISSASGAPISLYGDPGVALLAALLLIKPRPLPAGNATAVDALFERSITPKTGPCVSLLTEIRFKMIPGGLIVNVYGEPGKSEQMTVAGYGGAREAVPLGLHGGAGADSGFLGG